MRRILGRLVDVLGLPLFALAAMFLWLVRRFGVRHLPLTRSILLNIGVIPVRDFYYEPFFDPRKLRLPNLHERPIAGIDWRKSEQLTLLDTLSYAGELGNLRVHASGPTEFGLDNPTFVGGDAEFWYQMIRANKPQRIIEVGSGNSTLMARKAIAKNEAEDPSYSCEHTCIEPYEMPWLEQVGVNVIRVHVELVGHSFFDQLESGDILFIDSTHVIRPEGDVLFEYLEVLPRLKPGVIVHVHDIFSPRDYIREWRTHDLHFWNEQYLLEAFLQFNSEFQVLAAVNQLKHEHFDRLQEVCPYLQPEREPGSFYMVRQNTPAGIVR